MADTVNWEVLRDLARFRTERGVALSLYLDLAPSMAPTAGDLATRLSSLLSHAARSLGGRLSHDERKSLQSDLDRVSSDVATDFDRDGAHGLAIFASELDGLWRRLLLTESVPDSIRVDSELRLAPLVPLVGRGEGALVAVVGRERGELFRLRGGRLREVVDRTEDQPGRHDQGGWSQARYQRHIEHLVQEHLQRVAAEVDRRARRGSEPVVVVTTEETGASLRELLSNDALAAIAGWTTAEAHAGPSELLAAAEPVLTGWRAAEEERAVERWREEAGRSGRAAAGWETTLEAASDGRIDLLLYRNGIRHRAFRCPSCGRLAVRDGTCPLDGTRLDETDEGLDLAVHQTLSNGGTVWAVTTRGDLDPVEGIGALLRY
jgi:peptide chain release factor subunit 1